MTSTEPVKFEVGDVVNFKSCVGRTDLPSRMEGTVCGVSCDGRHVDVCWGGSTGFCPAVADELVLIRRPSQTAPTGKKFMAGFPLPSDSVGRKDVPLYRGLLRYFPAALALVARVSKHGNDKHNAGEPMHHARGKSSDHADCIVRHLVDLDVNGGYDEDGVPQVGYIAWRALALAQEWLEKNEGAPMAPGAKAADKAE